MRRKSLYQGSNSKKLLMMLLQRKGLKDLLRETLRKRWGFRLSQFIWNSKHGRFEKYVIGFNL